MKKCRYCDRSIHEDANFCPYCMNKIINTESRTIKKHITKKTTAVISFCIVLAILSVLYFYISDKKQKKLPVSYQATQQESTSDEKSSVDYKSYIGTWYSKDVENSADIYETGGGSEIRIYSINDSIAEIMITTVQSAPTCRVATTNKIYGAVEGNTINFTFQNDAWMSMGQGTITLLNDSLYTDIYYTYKDSSALWQLDNSDIFYKIYSEDAEKQKGNIEGFIGSYQNALAYLGEETEKYYIQHIDNAEIHTHGEVIVYLYDFASEIRVIEIDYEKSEDKSKYNFQGKVNGKPKYIDGYSFYEDVISSYGKPEYEYEISGEKRIYYYFNHNSERWYVEFGFNKENQVIRIICSSITTGS